jgi:hypothetical protein
MSIIRRSVDEARRKRIIEQRVQYVKQQCANYMREREPARYAYFLSVAEREIPMPRSLGRTPAGEPDGTADNIPFAGEDDIE